MVGVICTRLAGILFSLALSQGKPQHNSIVCTGRGLAVVTVCLETRTDDGIIRSHSGLIQGKDVPMGIALAQAGVTRAEGSRN